jgi:hypothetical protein
MQQLTELLKQLQRDRFYGEVILQFKAGSIELVRKHQTLKIEGTTHNDYISK